MNKFIGTGYVSNDPQYRLVGAEKNIGMLTFSITIMRDSNKELKDNFDVVVFRDTANAYANILKKSLYIIVSGELQVSSYTDKQGKDIRKVQINADTIGVIEKGYKKTEYKPSTIPSYTPSPIQETKQDVGLDIDDSELPF